MSSPRLSIPATFIGLTLATTIVWWLRNRREERPLAERTAARLARRAPPSPTAADIRIG